MKVTLHLPSRGPDVDRWVRGEAVGRLLKENSGRAVWRVPGEPTALFVKRFPPEVLRDRARKEARLLLALEEAGVPCPRLVAVAKDPAGTYVLTEEINDSRTLAEVFRAGGPAVRPLIVALGGLVRKLHDAGFEHQDFHTGNVLVREETLYVIDVHRARRSRALSRKRRLEGIAFTGMSFSEIRPIGDLVRFFRAAGLRSRADWIEAWTALRRRREQYYQGRQERCFKAGSGFGVKGTLVHRKEIDPAELEATLRDGPRVLVKEKKGERLSRVGERLFLKETTALRARRIWENAHGLAVRGVDTPRLWAWGGRWVAGEWVDSVDLYAYIRGPFASLSRPERLAFLVRLARLVRRMHDRGILHADLKSANVLVGGGRIVIVDLDRVKFSVDVAETGRRFNLAQLNAAVTPPLTRTDRLRFLDAYIGNCGTLRKRRSAWVRDIMKQTVSRAHHWPPR